MHQKSRSNKNMYIKHWFLFSCATFKKFIISTFIVSMTDWNWGRLMGLFLLAVLFIVS